MSNPSGIDTGGDNSGYNGGGVAMSLSSTSNGPSSGGVVAVAAPTPAAPVATPDQVVIGIAAQTFRVTCTGLKPNTLHRAYLADRDISANCAPISSVSPYTYGANLLTDASGYLQFDYAFVPQNSPYQTQYIASTNQTIAIIPAGNQAFKVSSVDGSSHAQSFIVSKGTVSA